MTVFDQLFWLFVLHFIADFRLQSDFMARNKAQGSPHWPWVLSAHAATHAAAVGIILSPVLGVAEFIVHAATDFLKDRGLLGDETRAFHLDQLFHLAVKIVWLALYNWGPAIFSN